MELHIELSFTYPRDNADKLESLFNQMLDGSRGAAIEDGFAELGEPIEVALEELLDKHGLEHFMNVEHFEREGCQFEVAYTSGGWAEGYLRDLVAFMQLLQCTDIQADLHADESEEHCELSDDGEIICTTNDY